MSPRSYLFTFFAGILLIFTYSVQAVSQDNSLNLPYVNYSADQGLPANTMYNLVEDPYGYIWIATVNGLVRYDGYQFETFFMPPVTENGPEIKHIQKVMLGPEQEVLALTNSGTFIYDPNTQNFAKTGLDLTVNRTIILNFDNLLHHGRFVHLELDSTAVIRDSNHRVKTHLTDNVYAIASDGDSLWIAGPDKLVLLDHENQLRHFEISFHNPEDTNYIRIFKSKNDSTVWVSRVLSIEKSELYMFNHKEQTLVNVTDYSLPQIMSIQEDDYGRIWILSFLNGLYLADQHFENVQKLTQFGDFAAMSMNLANDILWISGNGSGLHKVDIQPPKFNTIRSGTRFGEMEVGNLSKNIFAKGSEVWFLHSMSNPTKLKYLNLDTRDGREYIITDNGSNITVIDFHTNDGRHFWMGTSAYDRYFYTDLKTNEKTFFDKPMPDDQASGILTQHENILWKHSFQHIIKYDLNSRERTSYAFTLKDDYSGYRAWQSKGVVDTLRNVLWFCADNTLGKMNLSTETIELIELPEAGTEFLKHIEIIDGNLWIGMITGLLFLNPDTGEKRYFTEADGLPDTFVYGFLQDEAGHLWISTNRGISKATIHYDKELPELTFRNYSLRDGLPSNEMNSYAFFDDKTTGRFWFAGTGGLTWFYPDEVKDDSYAPKIIIDELRIFNQPAETDTVIFHKKHLQLPYTQNDVSLHLTAMMHRRGDETIYAWKLDGQDLDWNYSTTQRIARYTNLSHGNYVFHAKAANYDDVWSEPVSLNITITTPFWLKTWFFVLGVFGLMGMAAGFTKAVSSHNLRRERRKIELQLKIQAERERISRDLHDNVGAQITNIITGLELFGYTNTENLPSTTADLISNLSNDAKYAMNELRETIWLIDREEITLSEFILHLRQYLNKNKTICKNLNIEIINETDDNSVLYPSYSLNMFRIIQEAFTNTLKYARANTFRVTFRAADEQLEILIADDGIGISVDGLPNSGNGLRNIKNRVKEMNGTFRWNSSEKKGTNMRIAIPLVE